MRRERFFKSRKGREFLDGNGGRAQAAESAEGGLTTRFQVRVLVAEPVPPWTSPHALLGLRTPQRLVRLTIHQTTNNLSAPLDRHNTGLGKWTLAYRPWRVLYLEEVETRGREADRALLQATRKGREFLTGMEVARKRQSPPKAD